MARYRAGLEMRHVALVAAAGLFTAACGGTIPPDGTNAMLTTPSVVIPAAEGIARGGVSRTLAQDVVTFSLVNGRFKFTTRRGDLAGTYGGFVTVPTRDRSTVAMTLQVTEGTSSACRRHGHSGRRRRRRIRDGWAVRPVADGRHPDVGRTAELEVSCDGGGNGDAADHVQRQQSPHLAGYEAKAPIKSIGRSVMELDSEIFETNCF